MGFWKELGVTALEKGKNLFRGGKQAVEGAKHVEGIVKDAKVSIPATTKPTSYRAWEKSLSPPSFTPAFNQSKTGWKTQMKDFGEVCGSNHQKRLNLQWQIPRLGLLLQNESRIGFPVTSPDKQPRLQ